MFSGTTILNIVCPIDFAAMNRDIQVYDKKITNEGQA